MKILTRISTLIREPRSTVPDWDRRSRLERAPPSRRKVKDLRSSLGLRVKSPP